MRPRGGPCPYLTLGVSSDASSKEIRAAYYENARRNHPDRRGDAASMADVNAAYTTLCEPSSRAEHDRRDRYRRLRTAASVANRPERAPPPVDLEPNDPGETERVELPLALDQICTGYDARGVVRDGVWTEVPNGPAVDPKRSHSVRAMVPSGAADGYLVPIGDGHLVVREKEHDQFVRSGDDLFMRARISLGEALCGFAREVVHPDGRRVAVCSAEGDVVEPGGVRVFPGLGVYDRIRHARGDLVVQFEVVCPPAGCADYARASRVLQPD